MQMRKKTRGRNVPVVRRRELLLRILQQVLEALDALVAGNQLALRDGHLLLEAAVLLHKLALHDRQLLEVALQERHLLLLCPVVRRPQDVVVLLACLVERDFEFDDLPRNLPISYKALTVMQLR